MAGGMLVLGRLIQNGDGEIHNTDGWAIRIWMVREALKHLGIQINKATGSPGAPLGSPGVSMSVFHGYVVSLAVLSHRQCISEAYSS